MNKENVLVVPKLCFHACSYFPNVYSFNILEAKRVTYVFFYTQNNARRHKNRYEI